MVKYDTTYQLTGSQGSNKQASNKYIVVHATANMDATGLNEAKYMHNNYNTAYTHAIADYDRVYMIKAAGYVAWGAGPKVNSLSPFQIELAEYSNKTKALQAYQNYVVAIKEYAHKFGIPLTLDGAGNGIKTHNWVSKNLGGTNHTDPIAYLSGLGISQAQFAKDLGATVAPSKPNPTPAPSASKLAVDGYWGKSTTIALQRVFGTSQDGIVSSQVRQAGNQNLTSITWGNKGSLLIAAMQRKLGVTGDGFLGSNTIKALQRHYGTKVDGVISPNSLLIRAMQKSLNTGKF